MERVAYLTRGQVRNRAARRRESVRAPGRGGKPWPRRGVWPEAGGGEGERGSNLPRGGGGGGMSSGPLSAGTGALGCVCWWLQAMVPPLHWPCLLPCHTVWTAGVPGYLSPAWGLEPRPQLGPPQEALPPARGTWAGALRPRTRSSDPGTDHSG